MSLNIAELSLVEQRVTNDGPSIAVAYLFWFFLWFVSAHRFYLGRPATAIFQILGYFVLVGFIWLLIDLFLIPGMVRAKQDAIRREISQQIARG
ncbi:MAG: TM2 domain-containing protein [Pseudomonadota bacterium]